MTSQRFGLFFHSALVGNAVVMHEKGTGWQQVAARFKKIKNKETIQRVLQNLSFVKCLASKISKDTSPSLLHNASNRTPHDDF